MGSCFWYLLAILFFIAEMITVGGIVCLMISLSCLVIGILGHLVPSLIIQALAFVLLLFVLIKFLKPYISSKMEEFGRSSNIDSYMGRTGIVVLKIQKDFRGLVKVNGQNWTAIAENGEEIRVNEKIVVVGVDGVKLIVKPYLEDKE